MKIAQVSPLYESVPPALYGGTERIVSYLTETLVGLGHDVTLFASGDSRTAAKLVPACQRSLRLDKNCADPLPHHFQMLEQVFSAADEFDIIHFHIDYLHYPLSRRHGVPQVTTLHGRLDIPDLLPLYREYRDMPLVSISYSQRIPLHFANWQATVHHGLPSEIYSCNDAKGEYLAFLGRISPEKRVDRAVEIAGRCGMKLKVAAKIDKANFDYYNEVVKPLLSLPHVEYLGEIGEGEKGKFLGGASALLFPIDWEEPFGLAMIEAMACGTPVIAFRRGSVPEIVDDGITGFIVDSVEQATEAVAKLDAINRGQCRKRFEERFSAERMTADYLAVYEMIMGSCDEHLLKVAR